ncbi:MAG: YceD family protein, partial [Rubrobacteraceae bacterium]
QNAETDVSVTKLAEGLHLDIEARVTVKTTCDRTLEDVELGLGFGDSEFLSGPNDEELAVRDWEFDPKRYVEKALPTEVPMQVFAPGTEPALPTEDDDEIDSRWKGLDGLFASGF